MSNKCFADGCTNEALTEFCPECLANGGMKPVRRKTNEIEIIMTNVNEPPKIKLNGKEIKGIVELDYKYVTKSAEPGYHNFTVKYCDKESNTVRTVSANKIWEG
ncbi:hypothetical protein [Ureibacillus sinduriensis]|uniref:Uncharacterized protein n=1 Tax=Ureibacillus sinduriensis BLB-1 = JCM 15800 TaxID=1384057 RepID=A0A0A3HQN1_9BACL|nr:hypothetical protein [Ureibacillus sinduriensis]KGR74886.1 hypothetical protein CD33_14105 [Ureibacillus sinduriensis BLB-1 = JCM 15800]